MQICALIDDIALVKVNSHTLPKSPNYFRTSFFRAPPHRQMNFKEVVKKRDKSAAYFGAAGKRYFLVATLQAEVLRAFFVKGKLKKFI